MNLFRVEALNAGVGSNYGPIILARSWPSWMIVAVSMGIGLFVSGYLLLGSYTKRAAAFGLLVPSQGAIRLAAATPGVVTQKLVQEGQMVNKGNVLFVISDERRAADLRGDARLSDTAMASLALRRGNLQRTIHTVNELGEKTRQGLLARLQALDEQRDRNAEEVQLHARRIEAAEKALKRHQALAKQHFISEVALQDKEDQVETLRAQHLAAQRVRAELKNNIVSAQSELHQIEARTKTQRAELERELAALAQETEEARVRDHLAVTAPVDGTVTSITAEAGQLIGGQPLATLLPKGAELIAQLFAPSRAVGFVEKGQIVRIRFQAYPYQKFGQYTGTVFEVSRSPLTPAELPPTLPVGQEAREGLYRISVRLDSQAVLAYGKSVALLPGMALEADIEQERRRLIEWVLDPLFSARSRIF